MPPVVVVAALFVERGREPEAMALFERVTEETHREPGCLKYAWARELDDPTRFVVVENWRSAEDLDAHGTMPHMDEFRRAIGPLLAAPTLVTRYEPLGIGTDAQGSL